MGDVEDVMHPDFPENVREERRDDVLDSVRKVVHHAEAMDDLKTMVRMGGRGLRPIGVDYERAERAVERLFNVAEILYEMDDSEERPGGSGERPEVVCLCGSTRFMDEYRAVEADLTVRGKIVLTCGLFAHAQGIDLSDEEKAMLDELHLRKIDLADRVFVIDVDGYIGESTSNEIAYAEEHSVPVDYLSENPDRLRRSTPDGEGGGSVTMCECKEPLEPPELRVHNKGWPRDFRKSDWGAWKKWPWWRRFVWWPDGEPRGKVREGVALWMGAIPPGSAFKVLADHDHPAPDSEADGE